MNFINKLDAYFNKHINIIDLIIKMLQQRINPLCKQVDDKIKKNVLTSDAA